MKRLGNRGTLFVTAEGHDLDRLAALLHAVSDGERLTQAHKDTARDFLRVLVLWDAPPDLDQQALDAENAHPQGYR